jgi:hypothetical protein
MIDLDAINILARAGRLPSRENVLALTQELADARERIAALETALDARTLPSVGDVMITYSNAVRAYAHSRRLEDRAAALAAYGRAAFTLAADDPRRVSLQLLRETLDDVTPINT